MGDTQRQRAYRAVKRASAGVIGRREGESEAQAEARRARDRVSATARREAAREDARRAAAGETPEAREARHAAEVAERLAARETPEAREAAREDVNRYQRERRARMNAARAGASPEEREALVRAAGRSREERLRAAQAEREARVAARVAADHAAAPANRAARAREREIAGLRARIRDLRRQREQLEFGRAAHERARAAAGLQGMQTFYAADYHHHLSLLREAYREIKRRLDELTGQ